MDNKIVIYKPQGKTSKTASPVEVRLEGETIWLTQKQMAELFTVDSDTIGLHLKNIYTSKELTKKATTEDYSVVRQEGKRQVTRKLKHYNLDAIISVGYRVNSKRGTQFRIWANKVLKEYLVQGYVIDKEKLKKLENLEDKVKELQKNIDILGRVAKSKKLESSEARGIIHILQDYTYALDLLDQYDHGKVEVRGTSRKKGIRITHTQASSVIQELKAKFGGSDLFGKEKDKSFISSIESIYQTYSGDELYPSVEEKAANLLYFVVKNHSFVDGNKRIAAFIFIWFLEKNKILYKKDGSRILENNALVALTLMIAESKPDEKDTIVKMLVNLINKKN